MNNLLSDKIFRAASIVIIIFAILLCLFPFIHILATSLSGNRAILAGEVTIFPLEFNVEAYKVVLGDATMIRSMVFTIFLTILSTLISMATTVCTSYVLNKKVLLGKRFINFFIVFTMYFSGGIVPLYILVKQLGISNTIWSLIFPNMIVVYNMIVLKSFFSGIPDTLSEAALIDGARDFRILTSIFLPLSKPALATIALFYAVSRWNTFQDALFYITDPKLYTLQLKLNKIINMVNAAEMNILEGVNTQQLVSENIKAASIMFATIPILIVYPWLQKYFISGVMVGAVKG